MSANHPTDASEPKDKQTNSAAATQAAAGQDKKSPAGTSKTADNEEPALVIEADLPSDGRDEVGEAMIRDLPKRPELSEPPDHPNAAHS
jgi:hypothetical protein